MEKPTMANTNKTQKFQINFSKLREAIRDPQLKPIEKAILVDLLMYAGTTGDAFPSEETIANDFGYSDRYIRECLTKLKTSGWLVSWKKRGYSQSNLYKFNKELYFPIGEKSTNQSSPQIGTPVPVQNGAGVPAKEVPTGSQGSSKLQPLYEKGLGRPLSGIELQRLVDLCNSYDEQWVRDAIELAIHRGKKEFNTSYLRFILEDWKKLGKAPPKPLFTACNIPPCKNGHAYINGYFREHACLTKYKQEIRELKNIWGEEYGED